jgi:hypothetical protein
MKAAPEKHRLTQAHKMARKVSPSLLTTRADGNNGFFLIPHYKIDDYILACMCSDGKGMDEVWEHVSVTLQDGKKMVKRCPTWEEMVFVKNQFWNENETVMQLHPAQADYVNNHDYCLHLWRPVFREIPTPPAEYVGIKKMVPKDFA